MTADDGVKPASTADNASTGIASRRERRRERQGNDQKHQELLRAAAKVFSTIGYAESSLEDVAAELGVNRATLYYYVSSKPDLLAQVIREPLEKMMDDVRRLTGDQPTVRDKLRMIISTQLRGLAENYTGLDLIFAQQDIQRYGEHGRILWEEGVKYTAFIRQVIEEGQSSGEFRTDVDSYLATMALVGMMNWLHRWYDEDIDIDEVVTAFEKLALSGLLEPGVSGG